MKTIDIKWKDTVHTVKVDDGAYELLSRHTWYIMYSGANKRPYAFCEVYSKSQGKRMVYMHQLVTGSFSQTDHVNGDSLDNQFHNLRTATYQENGWNKAKCYRKDRPCTSKYKGVSFRPLRGQPRWLAMVKHVEPGAHKSTGKMLYIGYYPTEDDAARAYNNKVKELRGEWAYLNPVPERNEVGCARDR